MARRWWKWLLIGVIHWVGHTDLEVEFAITDAATGAPIPSARVEIQQAKGGFYEDRDEKEFVLVAGADEVAHKECRDSMCFGTQSGLRFTDTFVVHLPYWWYRVVAEGYNSPERADLDVLELRRQVRRAGPGKAKLVVPVSLHPKQAEP
jgi:hypothetical protein